MIITMCNAEVLLCLLALFCYANAFNLDTVHFTRYSMPGRRPSMFGFAVASHMERTQPWVIVGAPEAQSNQPGVEKGGVVYMCQPMRDDACAPIEFDRRGNRNDSNGYVLDEKSHQWFGATISSAGPDGPLVACAPRYVTFHIGDERGPVGTCFMTKNGFSESQEFSPCRTRNWGYHRQGFCQAGLGASVSRDGRRLFIGAPGSWYWQGQLYSINPSTHHPFMPPRYKQYGEGQLYSQSVDHPQVLFTGESTAQYDDSYLGYSVAVGEFPGRGIQGVAVGMPRGAELLGKVVLYSWELRNLHNLTGEQIGAYFGYSLCGSDVDGDGLEDLIVGAPMFTPLDNKDGKYDVGRIYIIYQYADGAYFQKVDRRDGTLSKGRFGLSLASLGDINLDGFGDFAVGAPYDGPSGHGVVYIFHGGKNGVREKPSQIIKAEDTRYPSITTFGFSLGGGIDLDNNTYNDLVVGAYESDATFLFRAKPVVTMTASILFGTESKLISLDEKRCQLRDNRKVTCTTINYCLTYDGINVDEYVDFELQFILDSKKPKNPRLFFSNYEGQHMMNTTIQIMKNQMLCDSLDVYIAYNVRDKLTPIEAELRYSMKEITTGTEPRNPHTILKATLDQNVPNIQKDSINIQKNCGPDNICIPDLKMEITPNVNKYLVGSKDRLTFDVIVNNRGEDAFEASFEMQIPPEVDYVKIERADKASSDIPVQCSAPNVYNNFTLRCDIGNPLPERRLVHFTVLLQPQQKAMMASSYEFYMVANSTNMERENTQGDNERRFSIELWIQTDLVVTGSSHPPDRHYNISLHKEGNYTHESEIGPQIIHLYSIRNNGPSAIYEAEVFILWPYETEAGDSLMYVVEPPAVSGNINCEVMEHVNDFNVMVDPKIKTYLSSQLQGGSSVSAGEMTGSGFGVTGGGVTGGGVTGSGVTSSTNYNSSTRIVTHHHSYKQGKEITEEEKRRIDKNEEKFRKETGDASKIHAERAQEAHQSQTSTGSGGYIVGGNRQQQGSLTSGSQGSYQATYTSNGTRYQQGSTLSHGQTTGGQQTSGTINRGGQSSRNMSTSGQQNWQNRGSQSAGREIHTGERVDSQGKQTYGVVVNQGYNKSGPTNIQAGQANYGSGQVNYGSGQVNYGSGQAKYGSGQGITHTGQSHRDGTNQWTAESTRPVSTVNRTYTTVYNTTWDGTGPPIVHTSNFNTSTYRGADGIVRKQESSTEYYNVGAEGDYGSSFNNRIDENYHNTRTTYTQGRGSQDGSVDMRLQSRGGYSSRDEYSNRDDRGEYSNKETRVGYTNREDRGGYSSRDDRGGYSSRDDRGGYYNRDDRGGYNSREGQRSGVDRIRYQMQEERNQGQGGSTRYEAGSYASNNRRYNNDGKYSESTNTHQSWNDSDKYVPGKWSTEESINPDLIHTGSATFHQEGSSSNGRGAGVRVEAHNTYVGQPQTPAGFGAVAGNRGFTVGTWDLGKLDTQKNEQQGGASGSQGSSNVQSYSSSYHRQFNAASDSRDSATDKPFEHFRWDRQARQKRQTDQEVLKEMRDAAEQKNNKDLADATQCPGLRCARLRCIAKNLMADHEVLVAIRARVNAHTLKKLTYDKPITLTSVGVARVSQLPHLGTPMNRPPHAHQASSLLIPLLPPEPAESVPLWVVVLAACAGAALLLLLIFALYKCGFFKRNRPSDAPERQPLNRNGYGHEDEQL